VFSVVHAKGLAVFLPSAILEVFSYEVNENRLGRIRNSMFPNHWKINNIPVSIYLILKALLHICIKTTHKISTLQRKPRCTTGSSINLRELQI
jgi:hypothetical protein